MVPDLKNLVAKLNVTCRRALEEAAGLCLAQTHYNVEVEHLLFKLTEGADTDLRQILRYYEVDAGAVTGRLTRAMEALQRGNSRTPTLSPHVIKLLEAAWMASSLHLGSQMVRSGTVLFALLDDETLRGMVVDSCPPLLEIPRERFRKDLAELVRGSSEDDGKPVDPSDSQDDVAGDRTEQTEAEPSSALGRYTVDLTAEARSGRLDPTIGREAEIRQIIDILLRRRQNNPILTGEAGVGKTAVVEGFASRVASGAVPPPLANIVVRTLDLGLLQAGAGVKGEFEDRLKRVISEVKHSKTPVILFIDEAHTMIGAGAQAGQSDAANLLKPALARGELRTIAATTWSEYKRYFEKDAALARRFQVVKIDEPDEDRATDMLRGVARNLEQHHAVRILDEAVRDAVRLAGRYITERHLPDKAISVLDTACARVAVAQNSVPPEIEDVRRTLEQLEIERHILRREQSAGHNHADRLEALVQEQTDCEEQLVGLEAQWEQEKEVVAELLPLRSELEAAIEDPEGGEEVSRLLFEIEQRQQSLSVIQEDRGMVPLHVDSGIVATVVSGWTGVPIGKMLADEILTLLSLKDRLAERIVGQDQALARLASSIQTSRANLDDPMKPIGVFLLLGPSGVGKTETALALADVLYGGQLVQLNMSEYQEAYTVSKLKGAPAGYVGYGKGGVLTEALRRNPYSVVLLDEVEKAHPDVLELFFQVFDKGQMEDSEGIEIDFRNSIILLTSNLGSEEIMEICRYGALRPDIDTVKEKVLNAVHERFSPAFLGRLVAIPYYPLGEAELDRIVRIKLAKIERRLAVNHRATFTFDDELVRDIAYSCTEVDRGARVIDNILSQSLLPDLSGEVLRRMAEGRRFSHVHVSLDAKGEFAYEFNSAPVSLDSA